MPRRPRTRAAAAAFLAALAFVGTGCARTVSGSAQPAVDSALCATAVMFVLDVSLSMEATDVAPNRLLVAQRGAREYAVGLGPEVQLGLITFAGTAQVQVHPTTDRAPFLAAVDAVELAERTATGEALLSALATLGTLDTLAGVDGPRRIILISDGKQTVPAELDAPRGAYTAADAARSANVAVSTISLGTALGVVAIPNATGPAHRVQVPADPDSLREIAQRSGGDFWSATTQPALSAALSAMTCHR
ncbi:VWA domain-containing protein [Nocardia neocaledoniensis]|uniref:VWA domain-containing protein n=1 Tax=Nocardia neocaledoniensis TaxID=236511 RepID=UPI0024579CA7|nr:VWA domain-containing protein [Nocardia neocaledoniensis]